MAGPYDVTANAVRLSPNPATIKILSAPPPSKIQGAMYYDIALGLGIYNNGWVYITSGGGGGGSAVKATVVSSGFTGGVNAVLAFTPTLIFWNDQNRFLTATTEWVPLAGGGFTITIAGFNSANGNYTFIAFA